MTSSKKFYFSKDVNGVNEGIFYFKKHLGSGGTANVYLENIAGKEYAVKIFHDNSTFDEEKIKSMISNPPTNLFREHSGITYPLYSWPLALISQSTPSINRTSLGYIMPFIDVNRSHTLDYFYDYNLSKKLKSINSKALSFKIEILRNLCILINKVHEQGDIIVDLKPQNICVFEGTNIVALIDCDGFTIKDKSSDNFYHANMVSPDYISPEISKLNILKTPINKSQDFYALAVIIFQMINNGIHPFQGILKNTAIIAGTNDEKAEQGLYPYSLMGHNDIDPIATSIHNQLLDKTRFLFDRAFMKGKERPTPKEWINHFDEILDKKLLVRCKKFPNNVEHMRFIDKPCPACFKLEKSQISNNKIKNNYSQKKSQITAINEFNPIVNQQPPIINVSNNLAQHQIHKGISTNFSAIIALVFVCLGLLFIYRYSDNYEKKNEVNSNENIIISENTNQNSLEPPQRINIENYDLYDKQTGKPRVWFFIDQNGHYDFFDNPGYHPTTGDKLKLFDKHQIDTWKAKIKNEELVERQNLENQKNERMRQQQIEEENLRTQENARLEKERKEREATKIGDNCDLLAANPTDPQRNQNFTGVTYGDLKQNSEQALLACRQAKDLMPDQLRFQYEYARALSISNPDAAIPIFRNLIRYPYIAAYDNLGNLLMNKNKRKEAIDVFQRGVRNNDPDSMFSLAQWVGTPEFPSQNPTASQIRLLQRAKDLGHFAAARSLEQIEIQLQQQRDEQLTEQQQQQIIFGILSSVAGAVARSR